VANPFVETLTGKKKKGCGFRGDQLCPWGENLPPCKEKTQKNEGLQGATGGHKTILNNPPGGERKRMQTWTSASTGAKGGVSVFTDHKKTCVRGKIKGKEGHENRVEKGKKSPSGRTTRLKKKNEMATVKGGNWRKGRELKGVLSGERA